MNLTNRKKSIIFVALISTIILFSAIATVKIQAASQDDYFFRVRILSRSDTETKHLANLIAQELQRIRVDSIIYPYPGGVFEAAVLSKEFDIVLIDVVWPGFDVNPIYIFSEGGSANYWGIDDEIAAQDFSEQKMLEGIVETNLTLREDIYHDWQENLMANILPVIPMFNEITTYISHDNLIGWDHEEGIVYSLPSMEWSGLHTGQTNTSIFVDYINPNDWDILNPLFIEDEYFVSLIAEPLLRINKNRIPEGVLAESWAFNSNQTILTINLREDVTWQPDIDQLYLDEPFDADDVLFSIKMYQEVSSVGTFFNWIDQVEKIDNSTVQINIDGNLTQPGLQPYAPALNDLTKLMLPEHYLNVSVVDGIPDTQTANWLNYGENCLGTGMYYLKSYSEGVESIFNSNLDWWGTIPLGDLNLEEYKVRFLVDLNVKGLEFESGKLDIFKDYRNYMTNYASAPYQKQTRDEYDVLYFGYNLKSDYCPALIDQTLTEDETMTKGLAVRKAIAHMIDKNIMLDLLDVEVEIIETPLSNKFGTFIKSDVTVYTANHDLAKYYMYKAGFDPSTLLNPGFTPLQVFASIVMMSVITVFIISKRRKRKQS
ncbi:MAG: ABC transporter substrate-binding protein [Candidatus Heimdallarchaeota archaeon]